MDFCDMCASVLARVKSKRVADLTEDSSLAFRAPLNMKGVVSARSRTERSLFVFTWIMRRLGLVPVVARVMTVMVSMMVPSS